jgi:KaiC/GvpD/RAD55 family RecA-like ATPase
MTIEFQQSLLSFLVQYPEGPQYIKDIDEEIFDLLEFKLALQTLRKYYKAYNTLPGRVVAQQYLEEQISQTADLTPDIAKDLREVFEDIYIPMAANDKTCVQDSLILEIQQKAIDTAFMDFAANKLSVNQVFTKINKLSGMVKSVGYDTFAGGGFLVADRDKFQEERIYGNPTFLHDLNQMTAAGGFYSPQLIVFLSSPKAFKTGIMLKFGIEYARDGKKVYYADNENGVTQIRNRAKMAVMECELHELFDGSLQEELDETLSRFHKYMGGDIFIDEYPAYTKSMNDVKGRLTYLKEEFGWVPDIIILDTIDKFIPNNPMDQKRDTRIRIALVYDEVITLNKEWGTFALVPSQVNRQAVGKKTFNITDLAEDFSKACNANSIWAICMTPEEEEQGIRRIIPVSQREGVSYKGGKHVCIVKVDEKRMLVEEINSEKYLESIKDE